MRSLAAALVLVLASAARAEEPRLDRVDYANPKAQLVLGGEVGAGQRTLGIARQLVAKGKTPEGTLAQIVRWVGRNLRSDATKAKTFRGVDQILADGTVGGDADQALVIGVLARAAGIPAVWVKTLEEDWIKEQARKQKPIEDPVGGTFLEVFLAGRWQLLDHQRAGLYEDYDVKERRLPRGHLAYDKGGDPYALVLSSRFDLWRGQLQDYLKRFVPERERWTKAKDLLAPWRVYVTGTSGAGTYAREAAKTLGFLVSSVGGADERAELAETRGKTLIVTLSKGVPSLTRDFWGTYLGPEWTALFQAGNKPDKPWLTRTFSDGTRVILITVEQYGPVELAVSEALEG